MKLTFSLKQRVTCPALTYLICKLHLGKSYLKCVRVAQQPKEYQREAFCQTICCLSNLFWKCYCDAHAFEEKFSQILLYCLMQVCPFSLRVVSVVGITYLLPQEEKPLCHPTVER